MNENILPESSQAPSSPWPSFSLLSPSRAETSHRRRSGFEPGFEEVEDAGSSHVAVAAVGSWQNRTPSVVHPRQDHREAPASVWSIRIWALWACLPRYWLYCWLLLCRCCSSRRRCPEGFSPPAGCEACWRRTRSARVVVVAGLPVLAVKVWSASCRSSLTSAVLCPAWHTEEAKVGGTPRGWIPAEVAAFRPRTIRSCRSSCRLPRRWSWPRCSSTCPEVRTCRSRSEVWIRI